MGARGADECGSGGESKPQQRRLRKLAEAAAFIDRILIADRQAPAKQRHTARRNLATAVGGVARDLAGASARCAVMFTASAGSWGWADAKCSYRRATTGAWKRRWTGTRLWAILWAASGPSYGKFSRCGDRDGQRSCVSPWPTPHATQQAFLEAHELAFGYFDGVFHRLRYDNLKSAVKKVLRGYQREETSRFIAFRSHWRFQSEFCNPARGNEKGGVEGEGGYFRRNHWVPLPEVRDLEELNAYLERCCQQDQRRILSGRVETVGAAMLQEQPHLLAMAPELFELAEASFPTVDGPRCVRVRTNRYSIPLPPGTKVEARLRADTVELWHEGMCVARHERCYSRQWSARSFVPLDELV